MERTGPGSHRHSRARPAQVIVLVSGGCHSESSCWGSWPFGPLQLEVTGGLGGTSSAMPHPVTNPRMGSRDMGKGVLAQCTVVAFPLLKSEPPKPKKDCPGQLLRCRKNLSGAPGDPRFSSHSWVLLPTCPEHGPPPPDLSLGDCHSPSEHALCRGTCTLAPTDCTLAFYTWEP